MQSKLPECTFIFKEGSLQAHPDLSDSEAEVLSVFVNSHVGAAEMGRFPKLKFIATRSTGFDHIDIEEAHKRNIIVTTVPAYGVATVAEFAFALLLSLSRKIREAGSRVAQGSFSQEGLTGFDLFGKTIGIVGCGKIGLHAVKIANGFGMQVLVYDVFQNQELAQKNNFTYATLEELLSRADIIDVHLPYMKETHHLLNAEKLSKVKKGAYLINTARGGVIDTLALAEAVTNGTLGGVGLDVLEAEDFMHGEAATQPSEEEVRIVEANRYLISHPRSLVTSHIAFDSQEALLRILDTTAENIAAFQSGNPPKSV